MTDNITSDTNFSNITITNDYPCLVGGIWTASVNSDGVTVYSNGTQTYEGPVNLIGGTLTVSDGAVVTDLTAVKGATITVNNGGTIENSDLFSATVTVNTGGISESNNYISSSIRFDDSSTSSNDSFYYPGITGASSGTLNLSQLPSGTSTAFQTSNGTTSFWTGTSWATNVIIKDPHFPDVSANNPNAPSSSGYQTIWLGPGCQLGNTHLAPTTDYSNYKFTLTNDNKTYVGGEWTASLDPTTGKTIYTSGSISVEGPINLVSISKLTITADAVVDGLTMTGNGNPSILNYGTIQNSFVSNGYLYNYQGGISQNNTYISEEYHGLSGSLTSNDVWYSGVPSYAYYNLSQMPAGGPTTMYLDDGSGNIFLEAGATWDNSYAGTDAANRNSQIYIYRYYGSDVACFLTGTMIQTTHGYVAIEDIQIGDQIITYNGTEQEIKSVIWKGYNTVTVNPNLKGDLAGYPIRILKNAISDGVPYKDMLITPEHCLFLENKFIPVYMLVNNCTIFYDHSITEYTYYHIET